MPLRDRLALAVAVLILVWVLWPVLRRFFCAHDWQTRQRIAGFRVPVLDQFCPRCRMTRAVYDNSWQPVARREDRW